MKKKLSGLLVLGLFTLLSACGGGGNNSSTATPLPADSVNITSLLPYSDSVDLVAGELYGVTDLTPNSVYTISLQRSSGLPRIQVSDAVSEVLIECGTNNPDSLALIQCAMFSNNDGQLIFSVLAESDGFISEFSLSIMAGGSVNEGTIEAPIEVSDASYTGGLLTNSYYKFTGLTPGSNYTFIVSDTNASSSNTSRNAEISVYKLSEFSGIKPCILITSTVDVSCIVKATATSELFVSARIRDNPNLASYTLSIEEYSGAAYISEGSSNNPVDITSGLPYSGEVGPADFSYYQVAGLPADSIYTISLQRTEGAATLLVRNAPDNGSISCGWDDATPNLLLECAMYTDSSGILDFQIGRVDGEAGGQFQLNIIAGGIVNEGHPNNPVVISSFPASGAALLQSYYQATGLVPNAAYTFSVSDLTGDTAFFFYPASDFNGSFLCMLNAATNPTGVCVINADASGDIYLMTNVQNGDYNVEYTMSLVAG